jgi:hypothetical protein
MTFTLLICSRYQDLTVCMDPLTITNFLRQFLNSIMPRRQSGHSELGLLGATIWENTGLELFLRGRDVGKFTFVFQHLLSTTAFGILLELTRS